MASLNHWCWRHSVLRLGVLLLRHVESASWTFICVMKIDSVFIKCPEGLTHLWKRNQPLLEFLYARGFWMTKRSLDAMKRGPSAYNQAVSRCYGARPECLWQYVLDVWEARILCFLKFESSRLFGCQRTCHVVRRLVARKSCHLIRQRFDNRIHNDG